MIDKTQVWEDIFKAARNGIYHAKEEYDKFTPELKEIVGSPGRLREIALMPENVSVEFIRIIIWDYFNKRY